MGTDDDIAHNVYTIPHNPLGRLDQTAGQTYMRPAIR